MQPPKQFSHLGLWLHFRALHPSWTLSPPPNPHPPTLLPAYCCTHLLKKADEHVETLPLAQSGFNLRMNPTLNFERGGVFTLSFPRGFTTVIVICFRTIMKWTRVILNRQSIIKSNVMQDCCWMTPSMFSLIMKPRFYNNFLVCLHRLKAAAEFHKMFKYLELLMIGGGELGLPCWWTLQKLLQTSFRCVCSLPVPVCSSGRWLKWHEINNSENAACFCWQLTQCTVQLPGNRWLKTSTSQTEQQVKEAICFVPRINPGEKQMSSNWHEETSKTTSRNM